MSISLALTLLGYGLSLAAAATAWYYRHLYTVAQGALTAFGEALKVQQTWSTALRAQLVASRDALAKNLEQAQVHDDQALAAAGSDPARLAALLDGLWNDEPTAPGRPARPLPAAPSPAVPPADAPAVQDRDALLVPGSV